jgi:hypothetical protein
MIVAQIKRYIYGTSGNELPPPIKETQTQIIVNYPDETEVQFKERIFQKALLLRKEEDAKPSRPYSCQNGIDWSFFLVDETQHEFKDW